MRENPLLTAALEYAARGWRVFPVKPRGKAPIPSDGFLSGTTSAATIRRWWTQVPDANIGLWLAGSGLVAVDVDPRNGGTVPDACREPVTWTQATGGGGMHFIYRATPGAEYRGGLGPGVDIKHKGYVLLAPSRTTGSYALDPLGAEEPVAPPPELEEGMRRPAPQAAPEEREVGEEQWAEILGALPSIPAEERDTWLRVGMALHSTGHPDAQSTWDEWSATTTADNFSPGVNERTWDAFKPDGALDYRTIFALAQVNGWVNPRRGEAARSLFEQTPLPEEPEQEEPETEGVRPRLSFEPYAEVPLSEGADYVVKGLIPRPGVCALYGPPGASKTWTMVAMSLAVATGEPFLGSHRTRRARVAYLAAESPASIRNRFAAMRLFGGGPPDADLFIVHGGLDFTDKASIDELVAGLKEREVGLVVLDTVSSVMRGEENSSEYALQLIGVSLRISRTCNSSVVLVHHRGKDATRGLRGHSAMLAALDASVLQEYDRDLNAITLTLEKSRDSEVGAKLGAKLERFPIGTDRDGEERFSARIVPVDLEELELQARAQEDAGHGPAKPREPRGTDAKAVLRAIERTGAAVGQCWVAELRPLIAAGPEFLYDGDEGRAQGRVMKALAELDAAGFIVRDGDTVRLVEGRQG